MGYKYRPAISTRQRLKQHVVVDVHRLGGDSVSLEFRTKAEEEALAEVFRVAEVRKLKLADPPPLEPCEPLSPVSSMIQSLVPAPTVPERHPVPVCDQNFLSDIGVTDGKRNDHTSDLKSAEPSMAKLVSLLWRLFRFQTRNFTIYSFQFHCCYKEILS